MGDGGDGVIICVVVVAFHHIVDGIVMCNHFALMCCIGPLL